MTDVPEPATPMPALDADRFVDLATRFFVELGAPWPSPLPPESVALTRLPYAEDDDAERTTRTRAHDGRTIVLTRTVWRNESTNVEHVARIEGLPGGVALELEGDFVLQQYRLAGAPAARRAIDAKWVAFYERVFAEARPWHEHPGIPPEWLGVARTPGFLRGMQMAVTDLSGPVWELPHDGFAWLIAGRPRLDPRDGVRLWMLGPAPPSRRRECTLTCRPPAVTRAPRVPFEPHALAALLLERTLAWTLSHDSTREVLEGEPYGPVYASVNGKSAAWGWVRTATGARVGDERSRIWTSGDWVLRFTELRSETHPDSFNVALQHRRGDGVALFGEGRGDGKPGGPKMDAAEVELHLLAREDAAIEPIVRRFVHAIEAAGWSDSRRDIPRVSPIWLPPEPPKPFTQIRLERIESKMSAEEAARFAALAEAIAADIHGGAKYAWRYREEWTECVFENGKLIWTDGWQGEATTRQVLADDDDLIAHLIRSCDETGASAIAALEEATQYLDVAVRPGAPVPQTVALPPNLRFFEPARGAIRFLRHPSGVVKQGVLEPVHHHAWIDGRKWCLTLAFYPSGKLRAGTLDGVRETVQGVPCSGLVALYESGKLRSAKLREDFVAGGHRWRGGQYVDLDESGAVRAGCLAEGAVFVRVGADGVAVPVTLPRLATASWETETGGRTTTCRLSASGLVYASDPRADDPACTCRELLEGAYHEALTRDLGAAAFRELLDAARRLYDAISDEPLALEIGV